MSADDGEAAAVGELVGDPAHERADDASFEALYVTQYAAMVRLAFVLSGRMDLAEELVQDAFVSAHRRWATVSAYDDPVGWVRRVVTNRCISSGRRYVTELRLLARLRRERPPASELSPQTDELWAAVRALPRRQAQVLALVYLEDLSVADAARTLGCGEATVRTHLRRGRRELARRLGGGQSAGGGALDG